MKLFLLRVLAIFQLLISPGYGYCYRCWRPWKFVEGHVTDYSGGGCFPLCESCWSLLTIEERLPYYEKLYAHWQSDALAHKFDLVAFEDIKHAVIGGK